ncbi:flavin reductase family protein [Bacillus songklensis]|uniref:Flavin reductase family protein n=1 Tax=Bacillus songklensis TaxID=1069116 RepID=A0ABV8B2V4_9BACI
MDDRLFRNAMGKFATGVTVITTEVDDEVYGMTANAFMSVSLDPKLVLISVGKKAKMHDRIKQSKTYAVSLLSDHQQKMSMVFAGQLKEDYEVIFERFNNMPVIEDALANITCDVCKEVDAGDHTLFIGAVTDIQIQDGEPLLFFDGKYRDIQSSTSSLV